MTNQTHLDGGFISLGVTLADGLEEDGAALVAPAMLESAMVLEFRPDVDLAGLNAMFGFTDPDQAVTIDYSRTVPDLPAPPRKNRRLQGKRYRIARRSYGRAVRAWRKAGRPARATPHRIHIPHVSIAHVGPDTVTITPAPSWAWFAGLPDGPGS